MYYTSIRHNTLLSKRTNMRVDAGCAAGAVVVGAAFDDIVD